MTNKNLIVTRHAGLVEWLHLQGIEGDVVQHATPETVAGKHVFGVLPLNLAAHAASVTNVDMPKMSAEQRGKDLSPAEMDEAGASLAKYIVLDEAKAQSLRDSYSSLKTTEDANDDLIEVVKALMGTEASTPAQAELFEQASRLLDVMYN